MLNAIVSFADGSALNLWILSAYWVWPILEIIHFFGLSLLFGGLLVIDLRLAGHFRRLNPGATHSLIPMVLLGFALNLVTGVLFFFGDPLTYAYNAAFQLKMILIALAGLNAMLYYWKLGPQIHAWTAQTTPPLIAKAVGYSSLALWTAVLLCGRLIPYVGEYVGTGN